MCLPDEGDVNAHVSVDGRAVEAEVHPKRDTRPRRVLGLTIKAGLETRQRASKVSGRILGCNGGTSQGGGQARFGLSLSWSHASSTDLVGPLGLEMRKDSGRLRLGEVDRHSERGEEGGKDG